VLKPRFLTDCSVVMVQSDSINIHYFCVDRNMFDIVFSLNVKEMIYDHVYIILDFPITVTNITKTSPLSISKRMSTSNSKHGSFRFENNENTYLP